MNYHTQDRICIWESRILHREDTIYEGSSKRFRIIFILKGTLKLSVNDFDYMTVLDNEMIIIPSNCAYKMKIQQYVHFISCNFYVEALLSEKRFIHDLIPLLNANPADHFTKLHINKRIRSFLMLLNNQLEDGLDNNSFFDLKERELFMLLFNYYSNEDLARFFAPFLCEDIQFKEFVLAHYLRVKNVQELASLANYSTSGFIKKFQRYFDESPYRWMQKQKANLILNDIKRGLKPLQEIAAEYNFSSYQHFANFCKIHFGFPPTEIAKR